MIDWNDCTPLTKEEWIEFINFGIPELKEMEYKNSWDFYINDYGFNFFCNDLLCYAYKIDSPKEWQLEYQKTIDLKKLWRMVEGLDWTKEEKKYRSNKEGKFKIHELIINRLYQFADENWN